MKLLSKTNSAALGHTWVENVFETALYSRVRWPYLGFVWEQITKHISRIFVLFDSETKPSNNNINFRQKMFLFPFVSSTKYSLDDFPAPQVHFRSCHLHAQSWLVLRYEAHLYCPPTFLHLPELIHHGKKCSSWYPALRKRLNLCGSAVIDLCVVWRRGRRLKGGKLLTAQSWTSSLVKLPKSVRCDTSAPPLRHRLHCFCCKWDETNPIKNVLRSTDSTTEKVWERMVVWISRNALKYTSTCQTEHNESPDEELFTMVVCNVVKYFPT